MYKNFTETNIKLLPVLYLYLNVFSL